MIISHQHKFIFIKTIKTAGTSVEIGLSKYMGKHDVASPIAADDEQIRGELGYRGPQNWRVPRGEYRIRDWVSVLRRRRMIAFYNHAPARFIRRYVSHDVWESYFKFCFERNPWDKVISLYFWKLHQGQAGDLSEFIRDDMRSTPRGSDLYCIDGEVAVDKIYRYEDLSNALAEMAGRVGLPEVPTLPRAKSQSRTDRRSYREFLSDEDRDRIADYYRFEIDYLGYTF